MKNDMFDEDFVKAAKLLAIGFGVGYIVSKTMNIFFGSNSSSPDNEGNTLYLVDEEQSASLYEALFSSSTDCYKTVYKRLNAIPDEEDVNIVIRTYGGSVVWCLKICEVIKKRRECGKGKTRVYVNDYAFSAGSIIALAADELYLSKNATLAPIDPQINPMSLLSQIALKSVPNVFHSLEDSKRKIRTDYEKELEHYSKEIESYINPKYDVNTIMEKMFHEPVSHEVLFFDRHLKEFNIEFKQWDGKRKSIITENSYVASESEMPTKII